MSFFIHFHWTESMALNIDKINTSLWSFLTVKNELKHLFESVLKWRTKRGRACFIPHFLSVSALDRANKIQSITGDRREGGNRRWKGSKRWRVFERAPDVIRIIRLAWLLRKQCRHERRGPLPWLQCPRIMKKPPGVAIAGFDCIP